MQKRLLSLLLTLVMVLPCFSMMKLYAAETEYVVSGEGFLPFEDIKESHWAYTSAEFCYINGIVQGQGNTYTFAPNATLTRATFFVMLARVMGADLTAYENMSGFTDCKVGSWYTASVEWAADKEYAKGTSRGKFSPDLPMTREQVATVIVRVLEKEGHGLEAASDILDSYTDSKDIADWAKDFVQAVVSANIMGSTNANKLVFSPKMTMTRAQAAKIFMSIMNGYLFSECEHELTEVSCDEGQNCSICGLVFTLPNGHYCETLSCKEGGVCVTCGEEIAPDALLHKYLSATCTKAATCSVCGATRGKPLAHKYSAATCTAAQKCSVCGKAGSPALGHTTRFGICKRCNGEVFASKYFRAAYYMAEKGESNGKGQFAAYTYYDYGDNEYDIGILYYDSTNASFGLGYTYFWGDGTHISIAIDIPESSASYEYEIGYFDANENELSSAAGTINSTNTTATNASYSVSAHSGANKYWNWLDSSTEDMLLDCIYYNDFILDFVCGESVAAFNFINFKY